MFHTKESEEAYKNRGVRTQIEEILLKEHYFGWIDEPTVKELTTEIIDVVVKCVPEERPQKFDSHQEGMAHHLERVIWNECRQKMLDNLALTDLKESLTK